MIITDKIYTARQQVELDLEHLTRTITNSVWLSDMAKSFKISPWKMYEIVQVGESYWRINATPEHLAATQKFYKIV
jgi:hypothetical protein